MNNNEWKHTNEDGQHNRPEYSGKRAHIIFFVKNYAVKDASYHGNHQVAENDENYPIPTHSTTSFSLVRRAISSEYFCISRLLRSISALMLLTFFSRLR